MPKHIIYHQEQIHFMSERVHYEDNLFYLLTEITRLQNGLKLSIDSEFFAHRIMEDIYFIDDILTRHYHLMGENPYLIRRKDFLFTIQKLKKRLTELLEAALEKPEFFDQPDRDRFPDLNRKIASHLQDIQEIRAEIRESMENPREDNSSLSADEYQLLMEPPEDE